MMECHTCIAINTGKHHLPATAITQAAMPTPDTHRQRMSPLADKKRATLQQRPTQQQRAATSQSNQALQPQGSAVCLYVDVLAYEFTCQSVAGRQTVCSAGHAGLCCRPVRVTGSTAQTPNCGPLTAGGCCASWLCRPVHHPH